MTMTITVKKSEGGRGRAERVGSEVIYIYIYINKKYLHHFCSSQAGGGFSYCNRHRHQKSGFELRVKSCSRCAAIWN